MRPLFDGIKHGKCIVCYFEDIFFMTMLMMAGSFFLFVFYGIFVKGGC
jgi:hypothetical protein